jgi:formylglycine-generating enzyme
MKRFLVSVVLAGAAAVSLATSPSQAKPPVPGTDIPSSAGAKISSTPAEAPQPACPSGMVEVEGEYCPVVEQFCVRQVDPKHPERDRCAEFAPTGRCLGAPVHRRFCIDRYEWPNQAGVKPVVGVDWNEAHQQCTSAGKRLCGDSEWTLACEGQERLPYPYGYTRNPEACNIDKPYIMPDDSKWANPKTRPEEITRLDQRDPSGFRESCISPYGVNDMTGNVDEWVMNEKGKEKEKPYVSGLKGGYWGPVRDRCRPMTTDHNQWHTGYQIGFRCCEDVPTAPNQPAPSSSPATGAEPASPAPGI